MTNPTSQDFSLDSARGSALSSSWSAEQSSKAGAGLRIGVLALQGDFREHLHAAEDAGATGVAVRRPKELDDLDGLIIPGGESTTIDKLARIFELTEPLRDKIAGGLP